MTLNTLLLLGSSAIGLAAVVLTAHLLTRR